MPYDESLSESLPPVIETDFTRGTVNRYIRKTGERIRASRSRRGMTRKNLSKHSGVSERYLAQAESGKANLSIALLWQIANALEVELTDLLPSNSPSIDPNLLALLGRMTGAEQHEAYEILLDQHFAKPKLARHGVALIGLRGAGKTRLGTILANTYGVPFIRLGNVIERLVQMNIGELFSIGGQKAYRRLERRALEQVLEKHPLAVVETGGSLVSQTGTYQRVLDSYFTVWIKAMPHDHMNRVLSQGDLRPMIEGNHEAMEDLKLILAEREADYRMADATLDTTGRSVADCSAELAELCSDYLNQNR